MPNVQELILIEDIEALGRRGSIVRVRNGYALNYLLPKKFAVRATRDNLRRLEGLRKKFEAEEKERVARARAVSQRLQGVSLTIPMKASDDGHLYGSVSVATIVEALAAEGHQVEPRAVKLAEPIKDVGVYTVLLAFHDDVKNEIKVWVVEEKTGSTATATATAGVESAETAES